MQVKEAEEKMAEMAEKEDFEAAALCKTELEKAKARLKEMKKRVTTKKRPVLSENDLAQAVSLKTGIPVSKVHGSELAMLGDLEGIYKRVWWGKMKR